MFTNFDKGVLEIIEDAKVYTNKHFKLQKVGTESLLYVMFKKEESISRFLLEDYRVTVDEIEEAMSSFVIIRSNNNLYTDKFIEVMEMAKVISKENNAQHIQEEHLLFALLVVKDTIFEALIKKINLNSIVLIEDLKEYFYSNTTDEVNNYSVNLTSLAKENKLNKMIGREEYLFRMKIILGRKNKNNILLIGSAGVGKTALVEGLCYELLKEHSSYEVVSINVASLVANTKYRGDFEARINKVLNEILESKDKILFIDEIHTIMGAGSSDNSLDIANIIKPYLVRDNFRCIGATTAEEYERYINKDKALARRFQPIFVNELNEVETLNVLSGILDDYCNYHNVYLDEKHLEYIIKITKERITNRKFPDKAIDLMDEAMCLAKIKNNNSVKLSHIEEAFYNICGMRKIDLNYQYQYHQLEPYFIDSQLGIVLKNNLVCINFLGDEENLLILLKDLKSGFGISEEAILDIDLAQFNDLGSITSLIGTSPGYVGYEDGGILSEHYSKFLYQIIIFRKFDSTISDVKRFIASMISKGSFYDKKGREFKTHNSVFIFLDESNNKNIGFIEKNDKRGKEIEFDLVLSNKLSIQKINPYIDIFKYRGIDLSFDQDDFSLNPLSYKKIFLDLVKNHKRGKFLLTFNDKTQEIEIINH